MPSWAGGWDNAPVGAQPYAPLNEPGAAARNVARQFSPQANRDAGAIAVALDGAAIGGTANATYGQVTSKQADGMNLGGLVPIASATYINRVTTAADKAKLDALYQPIFAPVSYPVDKSGNGGGSKAGTIN